MLSYLSELLSWLSSNFYEIFFDENINFALRIKPKFMLNSIMKFGRFNPSILNNEFRIKWIKWI